MSGKGNGCQSIGSRFLSQCTCSLVTRLYPCARTQTNQKVHFLTIPLTPSFPYPPFHNNLPTLPPTPTHPHPPQPSHPPKEGAELLEGEDLGKTRAETAAVKELEKEESPKKPRLPRDSTMAVTAQVSPRAPGVLGL